MQDKARQRKQTGKQTLRKTHSQAVTAKAPKSEAVFAPATLLLLLGKKSGLYKYYFQGSLCHRTHPEWSWQGPEPRSTRLQNDSELQHAMNVADLQDDDYDEYDDYGEIDELAATPSYLPELQPASISTASAASYSQSDASYSQSDALFSNAPDQSYTPPSSISPPSGSSNSYGGGTYSGGGINDMSSMGRSLPASSPPAPVSKYGGGDKCPRCNKTVYFAESKEGPNNIKYHR